MQRHTKQTDEFLELISELEGPFTVDDVSIHLAEHSHQLSRATLFRYLHLAVTSGELTLVPHLGSERQYERTAPHHHHVVCPTCEIVNDISEPCTEPAVEQTSTVLRVTPCDSCAAR